MDYEPWLLDLVNHIIEFEEEHPALFERGERVTYNKPVVDKGIPAFETEQGVLIGKQFHCFHDHVMRIPTEVILVAHYYKKGKEVGRGQEGNGDVS